MNKESRIKMLADRYREVTGEHVYSGKSAVTGGHYFSDRYVNSDAKALLHMIILCRAAGIDVGV